MLRQPTSGNILLDLLAGVTNSNIVKVPAISKLLLKITFLLKTFATCVPNAATRMSRIPIIAM